jgi:hypothetical protein
VPKRIPTTLTAEERAELDALWNEPLTYELNALRHQSEEGDGFIHTSVHDKIDELIKQQTEDATSSHD